MKPQKTMRDTWGRTPRTSENTSKKAR